MAAASRNYSSQGSGQRANSERRESIDKFDQQVDHCGWNAQFSAFTVQERVKMSDKYDRCREQIEIITKKINKSKKDYDEATEVCIFLSRHIICVHNHQMTCI